MREDDAPAPDHCEGAPMVGNGPSLRDAPPRKSKPGSESRSLELDCNVGFEILNRDAADGMVVGVVVACDQRDVDVVEVLAIGQLGTSYAARGRVPHPEHGCMVSTEI